MFFLLLTYPNRIDHSLISTQLTDKSKVFENVIKRSSTIKISRLASILEMDENRLLQWLFTLPDTYGFTVSDEVIDFDKESIDQHIDDLLTEFSKMEHRHEGKL